MLLICFVFRISYNLAPSNTTLENNENFTIKLIAFRTSYMTSSFCNKASWIVGEREG